jgi:hypothetical protein
VACREALATQEFSRRLLVQREGVEASPAFSARVLASLESRESWLDALDFRRFTWRLAPVTAAAALIAYLWAGPSATESLASDLTALPVSAALMSEEVADTDVVSLLLFSNPDDPLAEALEEVP